MKKQFEVLRISRDLVIKELEGLTLGQIHEVPAGFKNNIAWNVAHLVVTQQLLHYKLFRCQEFWENLVKEKESLTDFTEEELIAGGVSPKKYKNLAARSIEARTCAYRTQVCGILDSIEIACLVT